MIVRSRHGLARCAFPFWVGALRFVLQVSSCSGAGPGVSRSPVIYPPRHGGMEGFGRSQTGSIKLATTPQGGGHDKQRARVGLRRPGSPGLGQATDLAVTQAVVDQGENFAG